MAAPAHQLFDPFRRSADMRTCSGSRRKRPSAPAARWKWWQRTGRRDRRSARRCRQRHSRTRRPGSKAGTPRMPCRPPLGQVLGSISARPVGEERAQRLKSSMRSAPADARPAVGRTPSSSAAPGCRRATRPGNGWGRRPSPAPAYVAVAAADLNGFAGLAAKIVHLVGGDAHEIERAGIGEAVVIEPRAEPDRAVGIAGQHVLFHEIVDDHIDGRKRRRPPWRSRRRRRRTGFVEIIDHLQARSMPLTRERRTPLASVSLQRRRGGEVCG
jgi:hypothetical protein